MTESPQPADHYTSGAYLKFEDAARTPPPGTLNLGDLPPARIMLKKPDGTYKTMAELLTEAAGIAQLRIPHDTAPQGRADLIARFPGAEVIETIQCIHCGHAYDTADGGCTHCATEANRLAGEVTKHRVQLVIFQAMRDNTQLDLTNDRRLKGSQLAWAGYAAQRLINEGLIK